MRKQKAERSDTIILVRRFLGGLGIFPVSPGYGKTAIEHQTSSINLINTKIERTDRSQALAGGDKPRLYLVAKASAVGAAVYPRPRIRLSGRAFSL